MKRLRLQRADKIWLAVVGLLILLQFWWLPGDRRLADDSFSTSIEGKRGVYQTLKRLSEAGILPQVTREANRLIPDKKCTLVILSPDRYPTPEEANALRAFVYQGNSIVIAPSWVAPDFAIDSLDIRFKRATSLYDNSANIKNALTTLPGTSATENGSSQPEVRLPPESDVGETSDDDDIPGIVGHGGNEQQVITNGVNALVIQELRVQSSLTPDVVPWRTAAEVTLPTYQDTEILVGRSGRYSAQAASWDYGPGRVIAVATPDPFSNHSMLKADQAELAIRLINHARKAQGLDNSSPVVVSEYLNASGAYHGTTLLVGPDLRAGTLQLLTIAVLAAWWGFHRFGPAERAKSLQRRSLTESAAAMGTLFQRTASGAHVVRNYLDFVSTKLKTLVGPSIGLDDYREIALRARLSEDDVQQRLKNAVAATSRLCTNAQAAGFIRDLAQLLHQLSGQVR